MSKTLDEILDKEINDILDYVGRMQKAKSPVLFLGDFKVEAAKGIESLILEARLEEVDRIQNPGHIGSDGKRIEPMQEYKHYRTAELLAIKKDKDE